VRLELSAGRRWVVAARGRVRRGSGSFVLRWRAPRRRAVVRLRVVALTRSGRVSGSSPVRRVAVTLTSVLSPARLVAAPPPGMAGRLRYRGPVRVRPGEFVASGVGGATPNGLLARVVAVRADGGDTVADVVPASLMEAVPSGRLSLGSPLVAAAVPTRSPRSQPFRAVFPCSGDADGEVSGSLDVSLEPALSLSWSGGGVTRARAAATLSGEARLSAQVDGPATCTLTQTPVATWFWPPLRAFIGVIPVVVVPQTTLYLAGDASASGAAAATAGGRVSATAGLLWDGAVHPIHSFRHALWGEGKVANGDVALAVRVIPSVTFLLYGQAGPHFDFSTGLRLSATPGRAQSWTLSAPVELSAGLTLPAFAGLVLPQQTVFSRTIPLASGGPGSPPGSAPGSGSSPGSGSPPGPGSPSAHERARIAWDTAATDVDLHVWDGAGHHAWFRDPSSIPDGTLSEDDRHGFGPELFHDSSPGARSLTFGLCYFDDSGAGPTHVDVHLTDPGGSVHHTNVTLTREGDHQLIGSTPPGSGIAPPEGWCSP
jgi:hypothetical protein